MGTGGRGGGRDSIPDVEPSRLDKGVGAKVDRDLAAEGDLKRLSQGEEPGEHTPTLPERSSRVVAVDLKGVKPGLCLKPDKGERHLVVRARGIDAPAAGLVLQVRLLDPVGNERAHGA